MLTIKHPTLQTHCLLHQNRECQFSPSQPAQIYKPQLLPRGTYICVISNVQLPLCHNGNSGRTATKSAMVLENCEFCSFLLVCSLYWTTALIGFYACVVVIPYWLMEHATHHNEYEQWNKQNPSP